MSEYIVSSGVTSTGITLSPTDSMYVLSGGTANSTINNGSMYLSGGVANTALVNSGGLLEIDIDGTANNAFVYGAPVSSVEPWGEGFNGGLLKINAGGTATNLVAAEGALLDISVAPGTYVQGSYSDSAFKIEGGLVSDFIVNDYCRLGIASGGTANRLTVKALFYHYGYEYAWVDVSSGATVNSTMITGGSVFVNFGGIANNTTIIDYGGVGIASGAKANGITMIGSNTEIEIGGGGTATNIVASDDVGIDIHITKGTYVQGTQAGNAFLIKDGVVSGYIPTGRTTISSGCTASAPIVNVGCKLDLISGCTATEIIWTPCVGTVQVEDGAYVTYASQYSGVYYGSDSLLLSHASEMNDQTVSSWGCSMYVMSGGTANRTTLNGGHMYISSGGTANSTTVSNWGSMYVMSGGTANSTTVSDWGCNMYVMSGGTAKDTTVNSGDGMTVSSGGKLTGQTKIASGATVSAYSGTVLDFDISPLAPGAAARINDLSRISGWTGANFTLTVDGSQTNGTYALAEGASGFNKTLSVVNTEGTNLGSLIVGQIATIGGVTYALNLNSGSLSATVSGSTPPTPEPPTDSPFFPGCFAGGTQAMLAKQTDRNVTIYVEGETFGSGLVLDPGWEIAGVGDFNADGRDDFLRVSDEGYVVGEMTKVSGNFTAQVLNFKSAGWDILGTGDFDGNGTDDVLIANPTGASETVGLLGYWESGVTWTLINGYSAEWECVSTGDFNGDDKCDMLWRNSFTGEGGLTYNAYCTWIVDNPVDWRMVSVANPAEWNFLCSGDFDGNGSHDIAMINGEGVVGIWGVTDGYLSSWSILSAVTSEWQLAGVGDFNADGTDDIAWCNTNTGLAGYWQINNKTLTTWTNIAAVS